MNNRILVVDDEEFILTLIEFNLQQAGFEVITAMDGEMALQKATTERPDLIILDLMLPKMDGMEVCKQLRIQHMMMPILMLTAKDDEFDKVLGLELGADDYMTKPFSPREVVARVKAILRSRTKSTAGRRSEERQMKIESKLQNCKILPEFYEVVLPRKKTGTNAERI